MKKLTGEQLDYLQRLLNKREQVLHTDILREAERKEDYAQIASEAPDSGDAAFAEFTVDLGNAATTRDVNELRAIQAARVHMDEGTYGKCMECGTDIPYERLQAQPVAERCAPCQNLYEKRHSGIMRRMSL